MTAHPHRAGVRTGRVMGWAVLVLSVGYYAALAPYGIELADEGHLVNQIYRTYLGQLPYIDFHTGYTPGVYYWNAALFGLFGVNLLVVRLGLAVVNGLTVYCIYWLARRVGESRLAAAVTALVYLALVPFHDGQFAPFNIPYPAWYVTLFWLVSVICMVRVWDGGHAFLWLLAGVCAGLAFTFKQNSGLFNLAAVGMTVTLLERPAAAAPAAGGVAGVLGRWEPRMRWLVPLLGAVGVSVMFGHGAATREMYLFALPLVVVVAWQLAVASAKVARPVPALQLWRDVTLVTAGFAVVTFPWAIYFWTHLGTMPFLRSIFYIGVGYEQYYFIGYPSIGRWGVMIAGAVGVALAVGILMQRRWLPPRLVTGGLIVGCIGSMYWLAHHPPPMVEGFQRSVVMRFYDVAFTLVLVTEWAAIATYMIQTRRQAAEFAATRQPAGVLLIILVSAILMHAQLYPRSDFMHLVYAAPCVLVLGARLLDVLGQVWARSVARRRRPRQAMRVAVAAPFCAVALVLLAPALGRIDYLARSGWGRDPDAVVRLTTPRAPLMVDAAAGRLFLSLSATVRYVQEHSRPDQFIFTFPCLEFVNFLANRADPTRHGYYYPGSPGHAVEAEVIDALRDHPPRHVVALHDHELFFVNAPLYYFNLREFVIKHYTLERRLGMLDVLQPDGRDRPVTPTRAPVSIAAAKSAEDWEAGQKNPAPDGVQVNMLADTVALWRRELAHSRGTTAARVNTALATVADAETFADVVSTLDPDDQRLVGELVLQSRTPVGAAALAEVIKRGAVSDTLAELFLRIIGATGDLRAVVPMLKALPDSSPGLRNSLAAGLFTVASKAWVENYWYAPSEAPELTEIEQVLPAAQLIQWMDNPWESLALRSFAIGMAGRRHSRVFIPFLVRLLGDANEPPQLRADAAHSLVENGFGQEIFPAIGALLRSGDLLSAVLTVKLYSQAPETGRRLVLESMGATDAWVRAQAFWVAAAVRDPELVPAFQLGLADRIPEVRQAAAWALGNIGDVSSMAALQRAARDGNDEVEAFAERAIQRIVIADRTPEQ